MDFEVIWQTTKQVVEGSSVVKRRAGFKHVEVHPTLEYQKH